MCDIVGYHRRYLNGGCWVFAEALRRRFGWPLAALLDEDDDPLHVVALRDGHAEHLVDVRGILSQEEARDGLADAEDSWFKFSISPAEVDRWIASGMIEPPTEASLTEAAVAIDALLALDPDYFTPMSMVCASP